MIEAELLLNTASRGVTQPKFFHCNDNNIYLVKFNHPINFNRILLNEYFAYNLAIHLGLPMPEMRLINISSQLCDLYPSVPGLTPGIKIGFLKEDIEDNSTATGTLNEPYITLFNKVDNKEVFPEILAFDALIHNGDRTNNEGNFILTSTGYNSYHMKIIDHGHAFFGPEGNPQRLHLLRTFNEVHLNLLGIIYDAIKGHIDLTTGTNPFLNIINKIEGIDVNDLTIMLSKVPKNWGINSVEIEALKRFVLDRQFTVKYTINTLTNGGYFPLWKKEVLPWQGLLASSL
ncbi:HipA family kinase [Peribacillus sp. NPDC046944]|uniref:HipA family kinase n=1 Tax=unclassified Peribacillus TaxID=2675266 RepID=UPI003CFCB0F7